LKKNSAAKPTAASITTNTTSSSSNKPSATGKNIFPSNLSHSFNGSASETPANKKPVSIVSPYATTSTTASAVRSLIQADEPSSLNSERPDEAKRSMFSKKFQPVQAITKLI